MGQFRSPAFFVLLALGLGNALGSLWYADTIRDYQVFPVTRAMIEALRGAFTFIPLIIAIYYSGELVWRERDRRTHEMIDFGPGARLDFRRAKDCRDCPGTAVHVSGLIAVAVFIQTIKGYRIYELYHYFLWYVMPEWIMGSNSRRSRFSCRRFTPEICRLGNHRALSRRAGDRRQCRLRPSSLSVRTV